MLQAPVPRVVGHRFDATARVGHLSDVIRVRPHGARRNRESSRLSLVPVGAWCRAADLRKREVLSNASRRAGCRRSRVDPVDELDDETSCGNSVTWLEIATSFVLLFSSSVCQIVSSG